jgi:Tol biopolymer transport system component
MKSDGSDIVDVTNVPGADSYNFIWSLNGAQIYYQLDTSNRSDIYIVDLDGKNPQNLTGGLGSSFAPQWIGY